VGQQIVEALVFLAFLPFLAFPVSFRRLEREVLLVILEILGCLISFHFEDLKGRMELVILGFVSHF